MHPLVSSLFLIAAFLGLSYLIFQRVKFSQYLYSLIGIIVVGTISTSRKRIEFIQQVFKTKALFKIRMLENGSLALPFSCVLFYKGELLLALLLMLAALTLVLVPANVKLNKTIPSPFSRFPFEFTRGFRRFFLLNIVAYVLTYFAIESRNFNLTAFFLLVSFLISATYYSVAEPLYYLWIYQHNPKLLVRHKLLIIFTYSMIPVIPIATSMIIFFPLYYWATLLLLLIGIIYVTLFMFAKYANYPFEMSITDGFIVAASILFPPLSLITIPIFYSRSVKTLNKILSD